jgi:hypothetical protein
MKAKKHLEWAQTYIKMRESVMKDMFDQLEEIAPEYL